MTSTQRKLRMAESIAHKKALEALAANDTPKFMRWTRAAEQLKQARRGVDFTEAEIDRFVNLDD